jgi:hypothetical protein
LTRDRQCGSFKRVNEKRSIEAAMSLKPFVVPAVLTALALAGAVWSPSVAQVRHAAKHHVRAARSVRPHIVVTPGRLLYRRCVDWLELQHRPSGTVLFPKYRCWWVRG